MAQPAKGDTDAWSTPVIVSSKTGDDIEGVQSPGTRLARAVDDDDEMPELEPAPPPLSAEEFTAFLESCTPAALRKRVATDVFTTLRTLVETDVCAHLPGWILLTARIIHPTRDVAFLRTSCHATCARLRQLCATHRIGARHVAFGDDHELMIIEEAVVVQSYAFKHEATLTLFDPAIPLHRLIICDADAYSTIVPTVEEIV